MFQWLLYPLVFPSSLNSCVFIWRSVYFCSSFIFFRTQCKSGSRLLRSICLLRLRDLLAVMNPTWPWDRSDGGEIALVRILHIVDHSRPSLLRESQKSIFLFSLPSSNLTVMMFQTGKFVFLCFFYDGFLVMQSSLNGSLFFLFNLPLKFRPTETERQHPSDVHICQSPL